MTTEARNFRILISIGGGPEAYAGLRFAAKLGAGTCTDAALLYVRPLDSGLRSGGMELRVARENMLGWGLELPGLRHLKAARDILLELGQIHEGDGDPWQYRQISGDDAGEYVREYRNPCGGTISLRLRTAPDVVTAVTDEAGSFDADLVIVGGSAPVTGLKKILVPKPLSLRIAARAHCPVVVARNIEPGHGLLVCVEDTERSRAFLPRAVRFADTCGHAVTLLSVATDPAGEPAARRAVANAAVIFTRAGLPCPIQRVETGRPVEVITRLGADFSLIVLGESEKPWFAKGFSVAHEVAAKAVGSILILK